MIDLTPLDVRKKRGDFRQKLRGYDPEEVDTFLELVAERFESLVKDNLALQERMQLLQAQLERLEGREQAVQDALVSAQALRKEVQAQTLQDTESLKLQALREIELQRREAETALEARFLEAQDLMTERRRALEELERNRRKFLKAFRSLLERELDAVEVEEARRPLEDAPLDLDLRGWRRQRSEGLQEPADEPESESEFEGEGEPEARDPALELEADQERSSPAEEALDEAEGQGTEELPLAGEIPAEPGEISHRKEEASGSLWLSDLLGRDSEEGGETSSTEGEEVELGEGAPDGLGSDPAQEEGEPRS